MALLAVLNQGDPTWNGNYAQIEFHSYNERYEGSYPNLYFCFDVQARIVAINGGWWMIQANTTFNYGGVQQTHYIYTGRVYGNSGWYFVGSHRKLCGCGRSFTFGDGCSVSGYPTLSGSGSIASPTIGEPSVSANAANIDQLTCDIQYNMTSNPYNMYRLYVKSPSGSYSTQLPNSGTYHIEGLKSNTSYTYRIEAFQADGGGSVVAYKEVKFKTLENYPEISVTEVTYEIADMGDTDSLTFHFKSTDDSHVEKWYCQIQGGPQRFNTSAEYIESGLAKNLESYIDVWTEDTLGRMSSKFRQEFHTTFTKMTVWRFNGQVWTKGFMQVIKNNKWTYCRPFIMNNLRQWKEPLPYDGVPGPDPGTDPEPEEGWHDTTEFSEYRSNSLYAVPTIMGIGYTISDGYHVYAYLTEEMQTLEVRVNGTLYKSIPNYNGDVVNLGFKDESTLEAEVRAVNNTNRMFSRWSDPISYSK